MIVFIHALNNEKFFVDVNPSDSVARLKDIIFEKEGLYPQYLRIIFAGKQLEDSRLLRDYGIQKESTLHIILRYPGA